ncbi:MAG TPA: hypothetical protein VLJ15_05175 [Gammaproteobacteria bacterium]|nr:hypothetical protein [Gammaproteobacteria bacterium]
MAEIIKFDPSPKDEPIEQQNLCPTDDLGMAIQTLIEQMRRAPLQRTG